MIGIEPGFFQPESYERDAAAVGPIVVLTRPYFMLDQEVTADWYRRFLSSDDHPAGEDLTDSARHADLRFTLASPDWNSALLFCNWLSRREGRTPCYQIPSKEEAVTATCDFRANGYRLPTDAEWECAFRCASTTRYVTGDDVNRMLDYGRVFATYPGLGKAFFPNPWGLFDLLGNAWEMCWDFPSSPNGLAIDPVGSVGKLCATHGGSAEAGLHYLHGSARTSNDTSNQARFRVVCGPAESGPPLKGHAPAIAALSKPVGELPASAAYARATLYLEEGACHKTLADLEHVLRQGLGDTLLGLRAAPVFIEAGDLDGYRRHRRALLQRFKETQDTLALERTAKACLLLPGTAEEIDLCVEFAQRALRNNPPDAFGGHLELAAALATYRHGDFAAAAEHLTRCTHSAWNLRVPTNLLHAMVLYRQKQTAAARTALADACEHMDANMPAIGANDNCWHDVLVCRILRREASALLLPSAPP
jgi:formylglycine-generating enzyme required for sulfatase activity